MDKPHRLISASNAFQMRVLEVSPGKVGFVPRIPGVVDIGRVDSSLVIPQIKFRVFDEFVPFVVFNISLDVEENVPRKKREGLSKLRAEVATVADINPSLASVVVIAVNDGHLWEDLLQLILNRARALKMSLPGKDKGLNVEFHVAREGDTEPYKTLMKKQ